MQDWDLAFSAGAVAWFSFSSLVNAKCSLILRLQLFVASLFSLVVVVGERVKRGGVFVVRHSFHEAGFVV